MVGAAAVPYLLRVFTFGLIAYVTDIPNNPNQIKLLLVDARHPPVATDGCPINKHEPLLVYSPEAGRCEDWCRLEMGVCRCPLERVLVELETVPPRVSRPDHRDMKYVPALRRFFGLMNRKVNPACLFKDNKTRVCPYVAAEASFTPQRVHSCELGIGMEHTQHHLPLDATTQSGRKFAFRSASQGEFEWFRRQYIGIKQVMVRSLSQAEILQVQQKGYLEIAVVPFDKTEVPDKVRIYPKECRRNSSQKCLDLAIANVPVHANQHLLYGRCQAHGIDRDFELFEDLTSTKQDLEDRDVPFDRELPLKKGMGRDPLCNSNLLEDFNRWLRTDQATSECSGGRIKM